MIIGRSRVKCGTGRCVRRWPLGRPTRGRSTFSSLVSVSHTPSHICLSHSLSLSHPLALSLIFTHTPSHTGCEAEGGDGEGRGAHANLLHPHPLSCSHPLTQSLSHTGCDLDHTHSLSLPLSHSHTHSLAHTLSHTQGARQKAVMDRVARLMRNRTSCAAMAT